MMADVVPDASSVPFPLSAFLVVAIAIVVAIVSAFCVGAASARRPVVDRDLKPGNLPRSPYRTAEEPRLALVEIRTELVLPKTSGGQDVEC